MRKIALLFTAILLGAAAQAQMTYQFTFSGATATATGTGTFTAGYPPNPGKGGGSLDGVITALSMTVTGATVGNGIFGIASFTSGAWDSGSSGTATLNLNTELVGQSTGIGEWGVSDGEFKLSAATGSGAPTGVFPLTFSLTTNEGIGDIISLTSFAPMPEPHAYALLAGMGLLGFAAWRRRRA